MEFVVALKWPVFALIVLGFLYRGFFRLVDKGEEGRETTKSAVRPYLAAVAATAFFGVTGYGFVRLMSLSNGLQDVANAVQAYVVAVGALVGVVFALYFQKREQEVNGKAPAPPEAPAS